MSMSVATGLLSPILWDSCSVVQSAGAETSVLCDSATVQGPGSFSHSSGPWMSRAECPGWTRGRNDWAGDLGVSFQSERHRYDVLSASFAHVCWTSRAKDEGAYEGPDSDPSALGFFFFFLFCFPLGLGQQVIVRNFH